MFGRTKVDSVGILIDHLYQDSNTGNMVRAIRYVRWRDAWEVEEQATGRRYLLSPDSMSEG